MDSVGRTTLRQANKLDCLKSMSCIWSIFVISLVDQAQRRAGIVEQMNSLEMTFEFVDAIDGRQQLPKIMETRIDRA